jgi:hypothetical protein
MAAVTRNGKSGQIPYNANDSTQAVVLGQKLGEMRCGYAGCGTWRGTVFMISVIINNISSLYRLICGHRIRHYGLFAGAVRAGNIERVRHLLAAPEASPGSAHADADGETKTPAHQCPCCGGRMIIVETFEGLRLARSPSPTRIRIDTS